MMLFNQHLFLPFISLVVRKEKFVFKMICLNCPLYSQASKLHGKHSFHLINNYNLLISLYSFGCLSSNGSYTLHIDHFTVVLDVRLLQAVFHSEICLLAVRVCQELLWISLTYHFHMHLWDFLHLYFEEHCFSKSWRLLGVCAKHHNASYINICFGIILKQCLLFALDF